MTEGYEPSTSRSGAAVPNNGSSQKIKLPLSFVTWRESSAIKVNYKTKLWVISRRVKLFRCSGWWTSSFGARQMVVGSSPVREDPVSNNFNCFRSIGNRALAPGSDRLGQLPAEARFQCSAWRWPRPRSWAPRPPPRRGPGWSEQRRGRQEMSPGEVQHPWRSALLQRARVPGSLQPGNQGGEATFSRPSQKPEHQFDLGF